MKSIRNKTLAPLRVPLGGGRSLHLGPGQTGHVADDALHAPALLRLIESGAVAVEGEDGRTSANAETGGLPREFAHGHVHPTKIFPSGNRGG